MRSETAWYDDLPLDELDRHQWESLCDGCGLCCLVKVSDGGEVKICDVACRLMDLSTGACGDYGNRRSAVPDCVVLDPGNVLSPGLLPDTCAYRLRAEGKPLFDWHHLKSGDRGLVHAVGIGIRGRIHRTEATATLAEVVRNSRDAPSWE